MQFHELLCFNITSTADETQTAGAHAMFKLHLSLDDYTVMVCFIAELNIKVCVKMSDNHCQDC